MALSDNPKPKKQVAIVTPVFNPEYSPDERISLRHLQHHLSGFDRIMMIPEGLEAESLGARTMSFDRKWFESRDSYSRLLLSRDFYARFVDYEYILIYQLDCLVFSDRLDDWCNAGYDYIGAPVTPRPTDSHSHSHTGNGGFSLRKVQSFIDVLESRRPSVFVLLLRHLLFASIPDIPRGSAVFRFRERLRIVRSIAKGINWYSENYSLNEDLFWTFRAHLFDSGFRRAPVESARKFSFERDPRYWYERNDRNLPFGCHAWNKWDRSFWEPWLLTE